MKIGMKVLLVTFFLATGLTKMAAQEHHHHGDTTSPKKNSKTSSFKIQGYTA